MIFPINSLHFRPPFADGTVSASVRTPQLWGSARVSTGHEPRKQINDTLAFGI